MSETPAILGPILCAPLLRVVDRKLIELLRSLTTEEWNLPTVAPSWQVRDVAAHLLDTALRKLSLVRDGYMPEKVEIRSSRDLVQFINRLNAEGVAVYRRLSTAVLIGMMENACAQGADFHESLDPFAQAAFSVSWAGEEKSLNWFDTARELTERWHHQQQIRLATDRPGIMTPELYHPVLDCFLRGLPHAFREVTAPDGAAVFLEVSGKCGGRWQLLRRGAHWFLEEPSASEPAARVMIPEEIAWRVFTKGIDRSSALDQTTIEGDRTLGEKALSLTAIVG